MSRTTRGWWNGPDEGRKRKDKKSFVYPGEGTYTKAQGGPGNKRGWKSPLPKWLFKKYKEKEL